MIVLMVISAWGAASVVASLAVAAVVARADRSMEPVRTPVGEHAALVALLELPATDPSRRRFVEIN